MTSKENEKEKEYRGVVLTNENTVVGVDESGVYFEFDFPKTFKKNIDGKWLDLPIEQKKITSSMFPKLLGSSSFDSVGKSILEFFKMTDEKPFDDYYTVRGDVGEHFAKEYLEANYDRANFGYEVLHFNQKMFNYDQFPKNKRFGGVIDLGIRQWVKGQEDKTLVRRIGEVKSKAIETNKWKSFKTPYENIVEENNAPPINDTEVLQGRFLGYMGVVDKILMIYVFFPSWFEQRVREIIAYSKALTNELPSKETVLNDTGLTLKDCVVKVIQYDVGKEELEQQMEHAYELVFGCLKRKRIPQHLFSEEERVYLNNIVVNRKNREYVPF
jgi:hypothetical protein